MKKSIKVLSLVLALSMALLVFGGCSGGGTSSTAPSGPASEPDASGAPESAPAGEDTPVYGGTFRFSLMRDPGDMDPHVTKGASSYYVMGSVYDTLVEYAEDGSIRGALAESWEQPDDKTYIFYLRKGVKFQDGTDFNADDVLATYDRIMSPDTGATLKGSLEIVDKLEKIDDYTVKFSNKEIDAGFLTYLCDITAYIISDEDYKNGFDFKNETNGTGAFILDNYESQVRFEFKKNPNYWKEGLPYLDGMIFTPVVDSAARANSMLAGEADMIEGVSFSDYPRFEDYVLPKNYGVSSFLRLNPNVKPLDDPAVREALNYIIDREEISALAWGEEGVPITDGCGQDRSSKDYYFEDLVGKYPATKDWDKAKEILKAAGYETPADVPPIRFTRTSQSNDTYTVTLQQMKDFGLNVETEVIDSVTLHKLRANGEFMMIQEGGTLVFPDQMMKMFHSTKGNSFATGVKYKNERLDELLELGNRTLDVAERQKIYKEAFQIVAEDEPIIWQVNRPTTNAITKQVGGYVLLPTAQDGHSMNRYEYVWLRQQ